WEGPVTLLVQTPQERQVEILNLLDQALALVVIELIPPGQDMVLPMLGEGLAEVIGRRHHGEYTRSDSHGTQGGPAGGILANAWRLALTPQGRRGATFGPYEVQFSTVRPVTTARSLSALTTVQLLSVRAMAAICISICWMMRPPGA